jgi:internalin A
MRLNRVWCLVLLTCVICCTPGCPRLVFFPDEGLETAIRVEISKPLGFLTEADLAGITDLDARNYGIRNISGIEFCKNLAWLDLDTNQISDLRPLEQLGRPESPFDSTLVYLNLDSNEITDVTPLAGLLNLKELSLFNNQVANIKPIVTNVEAGGALESLILDNATLGDEALNVDVPTLEALGVQVTLGV